MKRFCIKINPDKTKEFMNLLDGIWEMVFHGEVNTYLYFSGDIRKQYDVMELLKGKAEVEEV